MFQWSTGCPVRGILQPTCLLRKGVCFTPRTSSATSRQEGFCVRACVRAWVCACMLSLLSRVRLFATSWTVARQAPLFMGFSRQECWSGLPCPPPEDLLTQGLNWHRIMSPASQAGSLPPVPSGKPERVTTACIFHARGLETVGLSSIYSLPVSEKIKAGSPNRSYSP